MKQLKTTLLGWLALGLMLAAGLTACDPEPEPAEEPIASFQFAIDGTNFLQVTFTNFSQNATSYVWDFGDGNSSTEESPTHTYGAAGDYSVTLTATNDEGTNKAKTETITITDPDEELAKLAGVTSKKWIIQREGVAMGIGPTPGDISWWAFGVNTPLGERPCILDDEITFFRDGTVGLETGNTVWLDSEANGGWNDNIGEGCHDESVAGLFTHSDGTDVSAFANGGAHTFTFDASTSQLEVSGEGFYIGLSSKTNAGDDSKPVSVKTFDVIKLVDGLDIDSLQLQLNGNGFSWTFNLVHYEVEADIPPVPGPPPAVDFEIALDTANRVATFTNLSTNTDSYSWDFGDGNTSTEESPVHTYAENGNYTVSLTGTNANGEKTVSKTIELAVPPLTAVDINFETGSPEYFVFGGTGYGVAENPSKDDINASDSVAMIQHGDQPWAGFGYPLAGKFDFTEKATFTFKVYAPGPGYVVKFKLEEQGNAEAVFSEWDIDIPGNGNEWVTITVDVANDAVTNGQTPASGTLNQVVLFPGWDVGDTSLLFYVDDIKF